MQSDLSAFGWRSVKTKPKPLSRVQLLCRDGIVRCGVYNPEARMSYFSPWTIDDDCLEHIFDVVEIFHWKSE